MMLVKLGRRPEVNQPQPAIQRIHKPLHAPQPLPHLEHIPLQQHIRRLEIGMRVPQLMHEPYRFEDLVEETFDEDSWEAFVLVLFDQVVEGAAELLEDDAVVVAVIEGFDEVDDAE